MRLPWHRQKEIRRQLKYSIKKYPDGSQYVTIDNDGRYLNFRINSYDDLWTLNQINDALKHLKRTAILIIPNLIDAQADRRFNDNESFGLKLVCEFINRMTAFVEVKVFHPHNPDVVAAIIDRVKIVDNYDLVYEVLSTIKGVNYNNNAIAMQDNLILFSADAGGYKSLMKLADKLEWQGETYSANKSRSYVDGKSILTQQVDRDDFQGKDILIVDDICIYGGTFKGLSELLADKNVGKLYLVVSHMTVQQLGNDPVTNYFDTIFTTDSKYDSYYDGRHMDDPTNVMVIPFNDIIY